MAEMMPNRWRRLRQRPQEQRLDKVDGEPLAAASHPHRRLSMREELAQYIRQMRAEEFQDQETEELRAELRDFVLEDDEERVLSDYQLEAMAEELGDEAQEVALHEPREPAPEPEPEPPVDPGTVPLT